EMLGNTTAPAYHLPAYEWLLLCQTGADGDYDDVQADIKELLRMASGQQLASMERELRNTLARLIRMEIVLRPTSQVVARGIVQQARLDATEQLHVFSESVRDQTRTKMMLQLSSGMLALERGRPEEAKQAFGQARTLSGQGPEPLVNDPAASLVEAYLRIMMIPK